MMRIQGALTSFAVGALCARARVFHSHSSMMIKTLALLAVPPSSSSSSTTLEPSSSASNHNNTVANVTSTLTSHDSSTFQNNENATYVNQHHNSTTTTTHIQPIESNVVEEQVVDAEKEKDVVTEEDVYTGLESLSTASLTHLNKIESMKTKYQGKFICARIPEFLYCDVYLCGTLHVAKTSTDMVVDAIRTLKPHFILLELCEARSESLFEVEQQNVTLRDVLRETFNQRSIKVFGMGLLSWMQMKSANMLGNKLGGEITAAYKVSAENGALGVILGDRLYGVTIQRVFDKLTTFEKIKIAFIMTWEVLTMSFMKLADYIKKTESDEKFIQEEIARFRKYLPSFASVIIDERDEYLSQSLVEIGM